MIGAHNASLRFCIIRFISKPDNLKFDWFENIGQISHFSTHVKTRGGVGEICESK